MQIRDALYVYLLRHALGKNKNYPTEDVIADSDIRARTQQIFDSFFKFASVRNPWARTVSLFFRREGVKIKESLSFETFCEQHLFASDTCKHPTLHRNQLDWICDENGTLAVDYVYKVEEFKKAIDDIRERTNGRLLLHYQESNTNPDSQSKRYRDLYSDKTRTMIAERFERDIDYFKYTF